MAKSLQPKSAEDVGKMASRAGVKAVVLTHIPATTNPNDDYSRYADGVKKLFAGPVLMVGNASVGAAAGATLRLSGTVSGAADSGLTIGGSGSVILANARMRRINEDRGRVA